MYSATVDVGAAAGADGDEDVYEYENENEHEDKHDDATVVGDGDTTNVLFTKHSTLAHNT